MNSIMCVCISVYPSRVYVVYVCICVCECTCKIDIFLAYPSPCFLRQNLSLNLDLADSSRVAGQQAPSDLAVCLPRAGITATQPPRSSYCCMCPGKPDLRSPCSCGKPLLAEPSLQAPKSHHFYWTNMVSRGGFRGGTLAS